MNDYIDYTERLTDALKLIEEVMPLKGDVTLSHRKTIGISGWDELFIKIKSPNLKYHSRVYAPGGDSVYLGTKTVDEISYYLPFDDDGVFIANGSISKVRNLVEWAIDLSRGEIVEVTEQLSSNYLRYKGIYT